MLIDKIKKDLTEAMKSSNADAKNALRIIIGEIPRLNLKADEKPTDNQVQGIIQKLIKSEKMVCEYSGQDECDSEYISILEGYIPKQMTKEEVAQWLTANRDIVDLTKFSPQIKAMGLIMKHLKGKVNGNVVREILEWNDRADKL